MLVGAGGFKGYLEPPRMIGKKVLQLFTRPALAGCHKGPLGPYLYESEAAVTIIDQKTTVNGCRMHLVGSLFVCGEIKIVNRSREFSRSALWVFWSILMLP